MAYRDSRLIEENMREAEFKEKKAELQKACQGLDELRGRIDEAERNPASDTPDLETEDGKSGLAYRASFSRLGSNISVTNDAKDVAEASNQFAFDLYQQARKTDENLFLSPASVSTALAMTYAGAAGRTAQGMATVLHFDRNQNAHEGFSTLLELLNSTGDRNGYSLRHSLMSMKKGQKRQQP